MLGQLGAAQAAGDDARDLGRPVDRAGLTPQRVHGHGQAALHAPPHQDRVAARGEIPDRRARETG